MKCRALLAALLLAPAAWAQQSQYGYIPLYTTATLPTCDATVSDRVVYDTTVKAVKYCDGSAWLGVGGATSSPDTSGKIRVSSGPGATSWVAVPDCDNATTSKLLFDTSGLSFSCGTDQTSAGGVSDGDKGDITVTSSGATWSIDADAVTFAKLQNIATDRLIGRDTASSGDPEEISVGGGLEFTGSGGIQRSALTGDVTASAGSNTTVVVDDSHTHNGTTISALDTADTTTGTFADARVDGSLEADELTLAGDVDGTANANDLDEAAVEAELEGVLDLQDLQGTLTVAKGGTGAAPGGDDQVLVSDSTSAATWRTVPDCDNGTTSKLLYDQGTNAWSCGTDQGGGGGVSDGDKGDVVVSGSGATWTVESIAGIFATPGDISPSNLTSDQDDWNPTSLSSSSVIRVTGDASFRSIRSLAGGADGREVTLINVGSNNLLFPDESWTAMRGTTAGNRFAFGGDDIVLWPGTSLTLWYDGTSSRWRAKNRPDRLPSERMGTRAWFPSVVSATAADWAIGSATNGTNSGCAVAATVETRPMWWLCDKGNTTTGRGGVGQFGSSVLMGNSTYIRWDARVQITQLSDATDTWVYRAGLQDSATGDSTDGCYFEYTHSVNSGNWVLSCESNGTNSNDTNSGTAVAAATTYLLTIRSNPAGTNVEFFVNGVSIGNVTGSIPTGAGRLTGWGGTNMIASAGTAEDSHSTEFIEGILIGPNQ